MICDSFIEKKKKLPAEKMKDALNFIPKMRRRSHEFFYESFSGTNGFDWLMAYCKNII